MSKKLYDLAVRNGSYTDRNTGEEKGRWLNVGAMIEGDKGPYWLLNKTFNPAGVPDPEGKESVFISLFSSRDKQQNAGNARQAQADLHSQSAGGQLPDDDIPFMPVSSKV